MRNKIISILLLMLISFPSLYSQDKGWGTEAEINVGKGFRATLPSVTFGVDIIEGYNFPNGFYLGGGVGAVYANGLLQEIHQNTSDGSPAELSEHTITDISWGAKAFLRAKYGINSLPGRPFVVCDGGYRHRIGAKDSARMNTGFFVSPGIGGSVVLFGRRVYGIISYDVFQWSYEYLKTPHSDSDPFDQRTIWTNGFGIRIGMAL